VLDSPEVFRAACRLSGEVDVAVADAAGVELLASAVETRGPSVEFDCSELTFIDAAGVTMFLRVAAKSGKRVRLMNLVPCCRRVFEVLDLCEEFGIAGATPAEERDQLSIPA
jgi:anti-anti-sigma factor